MRPSDVFYAVATGPERRRQLLTFVGLAFFVGLLLLVIFGSLFTDRALALPRLLPGRSGRVSEGSCLWWARRFGAGASRCSCERGGRRFRSTLRSVSMVFVWTPAFLLLNAIELKLVEEPELEHRFGERYSEYNRCRVPMFIPRIVRREQ